MVDARMRMVDELARRPELPPAAADAARRHLTELARFGHEEWNAERSARELTTLRTATTKDLVASLLAAEGATELARVDALGALDQQQRERRAASPRISEALDVVRFEASEDATEILALVEDAIDAGCEAARVIGVTKLRRLASAESRRNQLAGPAFRALTRLTAGRREPSTESARAAIETAHEQRRRSTREAVMAVARVLGLDADVSRELLAARLRPAVTTTSPGGLTVGGFFDGDEAKARFGPRR